MSKQTRRAQTATFFATGMLALVLAGCGGGSASTGCNNLDPSRNPNLPGCGTSVTPTTPVTLAPLAVTLTDAGGAATTVVTPELPGTVNVLVKDSKGVAQANVAVSFTTTDKTAAFTPASATALTDAAGVAKVGLGAGTQVGAFTVTASATASGTSVSGAVSYNVAFPSLSFSAITINPSPLSTGGTAGLSVTVMNGASVFAPAQSVSFTSPCAAAGKATISSPVVTVNGVASTSYVDKGCGTVDTITASTTLAGVTTTRTGTLTVLQATAAQIVFVSALPQNIALKGTGGPGRQETSTVTFKVLDRNGNPISGVAVNFFVFSNTGTSGSTGGLTIAPTTGVTAVDGTVSTVVASGIVNTPVRISATISGTSPAVTSISDQLVVSTGVADQNSFSLSTGVYNVEAGEYDGCPSPVGTEIRVSLADHFNNPVPDGIAVSFTTEGAAVDASCLTGLEKTTLTNGTVITQKGTPGECSVRFCGAQPRPADGRVTVMAYALGEEDFVDNPANVNGTNRYDPNESFTDLCEPFVSSRAIRNGEADSTLINAHPVSGTACPAPIAGEAYIDSNGDGLHTRTGNGVYNGVLNFDPVTGQTVTNSVTPTVHIRSSLVQVLSNSNARITALGTIPVALSHCTTGTVFVNDTKTAWFAIRDTNVTVFTENRAGTIHKGVTLPFDLPGNILPAGSTIVITTSNGKIIGEATYTVPNTNEPSASVWMYSVSMVSDATQDPVTLVCSNEATSGILTIKVTTPLGITTSQSFSVTD